MRPVDGRATLPRHGAPAGRQGRSADGATTPCRSGIMPCPIAHTAPRDSSAGAIMAAGLHILARLTEGDEAARWSELRRPPARRPARQLRPHPQPRRAWFPGARRRTCPGRPFRHHAALWRLFLHGSADALARAHRVFLVRGSATPEKGVLRQSHPPPTDECRSCPSAAAAPPTSWWDARPCGARAAARCRCAAA